MDLLNLILRYLKKEGYVCEAVSTFKEGYKKINNFEYDCAIVDLNLPDGDGMNLVNMIRKENTQTGIVITNGFAGSPLTMFRLIGTASSISVSVLFRVE